MSKLININENGVAWVESNTGEVFGVVNAFKVLDSDGIPFSDKSAMDVLDSHFDIVQDWDREANLIEFREENGESYNLVITADTVEIEEL
mgnify:CR=1 FL=1|tara:strand:- start:597 stop:866 length:270 start_codon:yes stop_codon:yes gene_type:complete